MAVSDGHATTLAFGTSSFAPNIVSIDSWGMSREKIKTTYMGTTTSHTYQPHDLMDPGELTMTIQYNPSNVVPLTSAAETITLAPAGSTSTSDTLVASGFITGFDPSFTSDDMIQASVTVAFSGVVTGLA